MDHSQVLTKLIDEVVTGIEETTDEKVLNRYQRILDYLNMIIVKGGRK